MAISNERFTTLFLNWWEITEKDMTLSEMEDICKDIGMTRAEFVELVLQSNEFISKSGWTPEPEANKKVGASKRKGVNAGDSDQIIFETALTQIGIPYSYKRIDDDNGNFFASWVDLKIADGNYITDNIAARIFFTQEGKYKGIN